MDDAVDIKAIAERFLALVGKESGCPIIVCDERGVIVCATVRSRIGTAHAGAQRIMSGEVAEYQVTAEEAEQNPLVKEGYNCPMVVDGKRVGTFGVAGKLEVSRPLGRVAALVLSTWIREAQQSAAIRQAADHAWDTVEMLDGPVQEVAGAAEAVARAITEASERVSERVARAEAVVGTVQRVAQQSRILSINGAVEATRAGDHGRAFAVVAKDMTRLSEETKVTSGQIQAALGEVNGAFAGLQGAISRSVAQSQTLQKVGESFASLRQAVGTLEDTYGSRARQGGPRRAGRAAGR
jgi:sugar diacid utilization regulator